MAKPSKKMQIRENGLQDHYIFHPATIERIYSKENAKYAGECMALYLFFAKTAKWQKTNIIRSTDTYIAKSLKWGDVKIKRTKQLLLDLGLIDPVVRRDNSGKIKGYYLQINFLISASELCEQPKMKDTDRFVDRNEQQENKQQESLQAANDGGSIQYRHNQVLDKSGSGEQRTDALRLKVKMLKDFNSKMLKDNTPPTPKGDEVCEEKTNAAYLKPKQSTNQSTHTNHQPTLFTSEKSNTEQKVSENWVDIQFESVWQQMMFRKVGKEQARKAFKRLCKKRWGMNQEKIENASTGIVEDIQERFEFIGERKSPFKKKHLSTYLNNLGWLEEETEVWES